MRNSYKSIGPNGKANGVNFFSFCAMQLGNDYQNWQQHSEFEKVINQAHEVLNFEGSVRGLKLHAFFLTRHNCQTNQTKLKRKNCYNDVLLEAYEAGLVNINTVQNQLV